MHEWLVGLLVLAIWIGSFASAVGAAQAVKGPFDALPGLLRLYQQRQQNAARGLAPPVFSGSASVLPARAQNFIVSLGVAGVPQVRGHFCGGIVVAPHWVLTAAHCVVEPHAVDGRTQITPLSPGKLQVLSGTQVLYLGGRVSRPVRIVRHPDFRIGPHGEPEDDLALLQFTDAFTAPPIPLATAAEADTMLRRGEKIGIFGWGTSSFDAASPISTNLLFASVDVVDRAKCNETYGGAVTERMFCAGVGLADACQGDSGGPALSFDSRGVPVLVGVTSWGAGCCCKTAPGVYVDAAKFRGWIDDTVGGAAAR